MWTGGLPHLSGLLHVPEVPHLYVNRPLNRVVGWWNERLLSNINRVRVWWHRRYTPTQTSLECSPPGINTEFFLNCIFLLFTGTVQLHGWRKFAFLLFALFCLFVSIYWLLSCGWDKRLKAGLDSGLWTLDSTRVQYPESRVQGL